MDHGTDQEAPPPLTDLGRAPKVPAIEQRGALLAGLRRLGAAGGWGRFLCAPVEPGDAAFPERWEATPLGVARLARRLFAHGGIDLDVLVEDRRADAGPPPRRKTTEVALLEVRDNRARFELLAIGDDDIAGTVAHEIGVAVAIQLEAGTAPYQSPPRGTPEEDALWRGSVAAAYVGLGVLAANAAYQSYSGGNYQVSRGYAPLEHDIIQAGHLGIDALAFLVAVQSEIRGVGGEPRGMRGPQLDAVRAWRSTLAGRAAELRAYLGIDPGAEAPERAPPAPLPEVDNHALVVVPDARAGDSRPKRVYRVAYSRRGLGFLIGIVGGGAVAMAVGGSSPIIAIALAVGGAGGFLAGQKRKVWRCSECLSTVAAEAAHCAHCGGLIAGELASREDRLDVEDDGPVV